MQTPILLVAETHIAILSRGTKRKVLTLLQIVPLMEMYAFTYTLIITIILLKYK